MGGFVDSGGGEGFGDVQKKANPGRKLLETEDEGKFSCEKLRVVLAVLLVVAVCQNAPLEINIQAKMPKSRFRDLQNISGPLIR